MSFRSEKWDPALIVGQIVTMQAAYYVVTSFIVLVMEAITGSNVTLAHVLDFRSFAFDNVMGWAIIASHILASIAGCWLLALIVQRAKLCLDFATTLFGFHLLLTRYYSGEIPTSFTWWLVTIACIAIMSIGGEQLCLQKELEPITLLGARKRQTSRLNVSQGNGDVIEMGELLGENAV